MADGQPEILRSLAAAFGGRRVAVAMSGGVDSSVAAALLRDAGADVVGVTLKMRDCQGDGYQGACCSASGIDGAARVAGSLDIPHFTIDCRAEFEEMVLRPAWNDYELGRTPSPCLVCNERIKFGLLRDWARKAVGADVLATGHYADLSESMPLRFVRPLDLHKDQTYFLCRVNPDDGLAFPLKGLTKPMVREIARGHGLAVADAPDSQDACYLTPGACFADILCRKFGGRVVPGRLVDDNGVQVGVHSGIHLFTVGQRRGFCVGDSRRRWVMEVDAVSGDVMVTTDPARLEAHAMIVSGVRMAGGAADLPPECLVVVRHGQVPVSAVSSGLGDGSFLVRFKAPVRAVTPGQAAAFYLGDQLVGGAWIDSSIRDRG